MSFRIGSGFDIHRLEKGRPLNIGGITIPYDKGSLGHSDGDVLIHAICDSILGAINKGDLGKYFPSDDTETKGINSLVILEKINSVLLSGQHRIINIDATIILQEPKITGFIPEMKKKLCSVLKIEEDQLSIKSKTTDHLGVIGQGDAVATICSTLVGT